MKRVHFALVLMFGITAVASAGDWPAWRGPTGQGISDEKNVPLKWSAKENVKWKVPLANQGNSTPVIWKDRIFLTQANKGGTERSLLCFNRADGTLRWQKDVAYPNKEPNWNESWYANASPVVESDRVVVCYGSAGLYCYDHDGKELWRRTDLGTWHHGFGNSASPVLYGDLVIQWCGVNDGKARNFLLGADKKSGKTVWERDEKFGSWSTPVLAKVKGKDQLVLGYSTDVKNAPIEKTGYLRGYDPKTGDELWKCQGLNSYVYTSTIVADDMAVAMCGFGGSAIAVKLGGTGDISKERLWFHQAPADQRVGSGVIVDGHVYVVDNSATPHCYVLKTGEDLWKKEARLRGGAPWGSMVYADGRLYLMMRNSMTVVLDAKPKFDILAENALAGEETVSSPAISDGQIFLRTYKSLWCIETKK